MEIGNYKVDWKNWDFGTKTIFSASCLAVISMFLPWVSANMGGASASASGIEKGAWLFLGFFIYQNMKILKNEKMQRKLANRLSWGAIVFAIFWLFFLGDTKYVSAGGGWGLFFLSAIALRVGVWKTSLKID
jgi:hypothetical protein